MRAKKIIKEISKSGVKPYLEGRKNFENPTEEIEKLAQQRLEVCKECEFFGIENIEFLKVKDKYLPDASDRYCIDCSCIISYKIRQTQKPCKKWQEEK